MMYQTIKEAAEHSTILYSYMEAYDDDELLRWRDEVEWEMNGIIDDMEEYGADQNMLNQLCETAHFAELLGADYDNASEVLEK